MRRAVRHRIELNADRRHGSLKFLGSFLLLCSDRGLTRSLVKVRKGRRWRRVEAQADKSGEQQSAAEDRARKWSALSIDLGIGSPGLDVRMIVHRLFVAS